MTYGSELVAERIAVQLIMEYRYELHMLGVQLDGPSLMLGDNNSVVVNTTVPSSPLKKKHNAIAYNSIREAIACGIIYFAKIASSDNYADILMKPLSSEKFCRLVDPVLFQKPSGFGGNNKKILKKEKNEEMDREAEYDDVPAGPSITLIRNREDES